MADKEIAFIAKLKDSMSKPLSGIQQKSLAFKKDMEGINKTLRPMNQAFAEVKKTMGTVALGLGAVGAAVGGVYLAFNKFNQMLGDVAKQGDTYAKASKRMAVSVEWLSGMDHAAKLAGSSMEDLEKGMLGLARAIGDAEKGGQKGKLFEALGINIKDAAGAIKDNESLFRELADRFQAMPDGAEKTFVAMELLGKSGANLIPLLNQGADAIAAQRKEAEELGLVWTGENAKAAEDYQDAVERMESAWSGLKKEMLTGFLPAMTESLDAMKEFVLLVGDGKEVISGWGDSMERITNMDFGSVVTSLNPLVMQLYNVAQQARQAYREIQMMRGVQAGEAGAAAGQATAAPSGASAGSRLGTQANIKPVDLAGLNKPKGKGGGGGKKESAQDRADRLAKEAKEEQQAQMDILMEDIAAMDDLERQRNDEARERNQEYLDNYNAFYDEIMGRDETELERARRHEQELEQIRREGVVSQTEVAALEKQINREKAAAYGQYLDEYGSIAQSIAALTNVANKDLAKVMIPLEIAQAAHDFAEGGWPPNPAAIAAGLQHLVAAKQWAEIAKTSAGGEKSKKTGGGRRDRGNDRLPGEGTATAPRGRGQAIINVREGVVHDTKAFAKSILEEVGDAFGMDWEFNIAGNA